MSRSLWISLAALGLFLASSMPGYSAEPVQLVRLSALHESQTLHLRQIGVDFATEHGTATGDIDILVTPSQRAYLQKLGYDGATLIPDIQAHFDRVINDDGDMGAYHTYDEMLAEIEQAAIDHADILRVHNLGPTWETMHQGADRYIWAIEISDNPDLDEGEPELLFIGNTHAREVVTVEIPLELMHDLTDAYGSDPNITEWVNTREIWLVPMLNPDGHHTVANSNANWRKNRNRNDAALPLFWGVDLNRNWSYKWGYDEVGSSGLRFMETYRGKTPLSEPEPQALAALAANHDFAMSISYHSYGDLFLYTWSYTRADTPDHNLLYALGEEATRFNNYLAGNPKSGAIYVANGEFDDFMYGERASAKAKTFAFTTEVGSAFWPSEGQIPGLVDENRYAQRVFLELADYPWAILGNEMTLTGLPETVQRGDQIVVDVEVTNTSGTTQNYELWTSAEIAGAVVRQPLAQIQNFTLVDGATESTQISFRVPQSAPTREYDFMLELGDYPDGHLGQIVQRVTVE